MELEGVNSCKKLRDIQCLAGLNPEWWLRYLSCQNTGFAYFLQHCLLWSWNADILRPLHWVRGYVLHPARNCVGFILLFCIAEPILPTPWISSKFLVVAEMMHRSVFNNICFRNWFGTNPYCSFPFRQCCPSCLIWLTEIVYLFWKCSCADFVNKLSFGNRGTAGRERKESTFADKTV